jgi:hypothetical protein
VITGGSGTATEDSSAATPEDDDPSLGGKSIWWSWTAPNSGFYQFTATAGVDFDVVLAVEAGLDSIVYMDRNVAGEPETGRFEAQAGTTYLIAIDDLSGAGGEVTLTWSLVPPGTFPVMVYDYRSVLTTTGQKFDEDTLPVFDSLNNPIWARSVTTESAIVLRGRKENSYVQNGSEFGPSTIIYLYSYKAGRTVIRYYEICQAGIDSCRSTLIKYSAKQAQEDLSIDFGFFDGSGAASSQSLYRGFAKSFFASKLTQTLKRALPTEGYETEAQGVPSPGTLTIEERGLNYNSRLSGREGVKNAATLEDAEADIIAFLRSKAGGNYLSYEEAFPSDVP